MAQPLGPSRHRFIACAVVAGPIGAVIAQLSVHAAVQDGARPVVTLPGLLQAVVLAPVLEELVFRGGLQGLLERSRRARTEWLPGISAGNVLTSVAFALTHLMVTSTWMALATFVPSLVFGRLKQLYEPRLVPAMSMHAWYNLCFLAAACAWGANFQRGF